MSKKYVIYLPTINHEAESFHECLGMSEQEAAESALRLGDFVKRLVSKYGRDLEKSVALELALEELKPADILLLISDGIGAHLSRLVKGSAIIGSIRGLFEEEDDNED